MESKKECRDKIVLVSGARDKRFVSLFKDETDGSYSVMITHRDNESRYSAIIASGVVDFDDARLIFDRQSKIIFNEVYYEIKGA